MKICKSIKKNKRKGQSAVEYMILLGVVMGLVMVGFKTKLPEVLSQANVYYNQMTVSILGEPPHCRDCY